MARALAPPAEALGVARPVRDVPVAVSACLLGEPVRFDSGHKRSALCHERLGELFLYLPLCPEVAIGMGVPREPIRLVGNAEGYRAVGVRTPTLDPTAALRMYADEVVQAQRNAICGYLFMKNSPSCGMERVKVYSPAGAPVANGPGIYAGSVMAQLPWLPVEESGRMNEARLRENFVTRVLTVAHWRAVQREGMTRQRLIAFHSCYKFLLLAHGAAAYKVAGRLLADLSGDVEAKASAYFELLMAALARPATRRGHSNVLQHLQGYVSDALDAATRAELAASITSYRQGEVPLIVPITLLRHLLRRFPDAYATAQVYLEPHPPALGLRNEI